MANRWCFVSWKSALHVHVDPSHLAVFPPTVRRRREEPGCSRSDDAVLRPAGRQPGVRGHLTSARLSQRCGEPDVRGHAQHESPQPQHQQQQRSVRAEPQHQHHVGGSGTPGTLKLPPSPLGLLLCFTPTSVPRERSPERRIHHGHLIFRLCTSIVFCFVCLLGSFILVPT